MTSLYRRNLIHSGIVILISIGSMSLISSNQPSSEKLAKNKAAQEEATMQIQYLEIVTPKVDEICKQYSTMLDITFSDPDANLGNARTAKLSDGGLVGIRAPLRDTEEPVVRPYVLVEDLKASVSAAAAAGAEIAIESMEIPGGHGKIAIVIQGGIECGLWQKSK